MRCTGIPEVVANEVRETMRAQGYGPCRLCLRTFRIGVDERPVFIHAAPCTRYDSPELPPDFRTLPMVLEAYGGSGAPLAQERAAGWAVDELLKRIFTADRARYVHVRNGEVGCFMARVEKM
jgi:hypothetical protein